MCDCFERAWSACPDQACTFDCRFAGRPVRIRVVGRQWGEWVDRSTAHLRCEPAGELALRIDLWDQSAAGVPWQMVAVKDGIGIEQWFATSDDARLVAQETPHVMTWLDRDTGHVVGWTPDAALFNLSERARVTYFPVLLWLYDRGLRAAHAGLVARDGRGLLLAGESEQGKSTASLSCLTVADSDLQFVSDDHVWIERDADGFVGHSLYASVNIRPGHSAIFGDLADHALEPTSAVEDKKLLFLEPLFAGRLATRARIAAIALPRLVRGPSGVEPADRVDVLMTLAGGSVTDWSFSRMPGAAERFEMLARLAESVPCHWLRCRRGPGALTEVPRCIDALLKGM